MQEPEKKSESDDASSSSSFSSSSDSESKNALLAKLAKMRTLLKHKKMDEHTHKRQLIKEANIEKKRQEKQKYKN